MQRKSTRPNTQPDRLGFPPASYQNNMGTTYFNPGSAAIITLRIHSRGDTMADIAYAVNQTGRGGAGSGETWHHMADFNRETGQCTLKLVSTAVHSAIPHHGGAAMARAHEWSDPDKEAKYFGGPVGDLTTRSGNSYSPQQ